MPMYTPLTIRLIQTTRPSFFQGLEHSHLSRFLIPKLSIFIMKGNKNMFKATPEMLKHLRLPSDATDQQIHERLLLIQRYGLSQGRSTAKKPSLKDHLRHLSQNHPEPEVRRGASLLLRDKEEAENPFLKNQRQYNEFLEKRARGQV